MALGNLIKAPFNAIAGDAAAGTLKKYNTMARGDLTKGYDEGKGIQRPIYDTALGNYSNLSDKYASGGFANPQMEAFKFDPQSVFQDPEYQASMRAGTQALNSGAAAKGGFFGGGAQRNLQQFGQDTFAGRSDQLYKRGFDATNKAFDQNAQSNLTAFNMGDRLTQPLTGSANQLQNLATNEGSDLAENTMNRGNITAGNTLNKYRNLGEGLGEFADLGGQAAAQAGLPGFAQPQAGMSSLSGSKDFYGKMFKKAMGR